MFEKIKKGISFKKETYYIGLVLILLVIAILLFINDRPNTLSVDTKAFAVSDTSVITKIIICHGKDSLVFKRQGTQWLINSIYPVKKRAMNSMLGALMSFEVEAPAPKESLTRIEETMKQYPLSVTIRNSRRILKKYYVCDKENQENGSYMTLDGQHAVYGVHLPGFEGKLSILLNSDPFIWRDRVAFRYHEGEIQTVQVEYPSDQKASFELISSDNQNTMVRSFLGNNKKGIQPQAAAQFLMNFSFIPFEWIKSRQLHTLSDSLNQVKPYCIIRIKDSYGTLNQMSLYKIPDALLKNKYNPYRLYAIQQNDHLPLLVKYTDFDPILKTWEDFTPQ